MAKKGPAVASVARNRMLVIATNGASVVARRSFGAGPWVALIDLRGGFRQFAVRVACVALGVGTIAMFGIVAQFNSCAE